MVPNKSDFEVDMDYEVSHILAHRHKIGSSKCEMLVQFTGFDPEDMQFVPEAEAKASAPDAHRKYVKQQESLEAARRGELTTAPVEEHVLR